MLTGRTVRLFSGQMVPVVKVSARGLYTWNEAALINEMIRQVEEQATKSERMPPTGK